MDAQESAQCLIWIVALCAMAGCEQSGSRRMPTPVAVPSAPLPTGPTGGIEEAEVGDRLSRDRNDSAPLAMPPDLGLGYDAFDQSPGQGWRKLAEAGNFVGAARLVDSYLERQAGLPGWQRINLQFHAGQLYAFAGDNETALSRFRASMNPLEAADAPIRWNAYVRATIAFLERDRLQLVKMRDEIAQGPISQGIVPNLDVAERLLYNFDQPYSVAYAMPPSKSAE
jgi:hypothetical protein